MTRPPRTSSMNHKPLPAAPVICAQVVQSSLPLCCQEVENGVKVSGRRGVNARCQFRGRRASGQEGMEMG